MRIILKHRSRSLEREDQGAIAALDAADGLVTTLKLYKDSPEHVVVYWTHELTILRICQAVRCGVIRTDEIEIWTETNVKIDVDVNGQFIQPWPTPLFEYAFRCLFYDYGSLEDMITFGPEE